jgi:hypothetical protein
MATIQPKRIFKIVEALTRDFIPAVDVATSIARTSENRHDATG